MRHDDVLHPQDQAEGLRQLFAGIRTQFIPVVSNPNVAFAGVLLERIGAACNELGLNTLVVDAGERAPAPQELALLDLGQAVEPLAPGLSYLAARGLPLRWVDTQGSTAAFLQALTEAAPEAQAIVVHASASELARLFARRDARPLLLADDRPQSVTHAYAGLKLLAQRAGFMAHDLLLAATPRSPRARAIATQLGRCADGFLGAVLHDWVQVDPASDPLEGVAPDLLALVRGLLAASEQGASAPQLPPAWMTATDALRARPRGLR